MQVFLSLQKVFERCRKVKGGDGYKLPHRGKNALIPRGELAVTLTCSIDAKQMEEDETLVYEGEGDKWENLMADMVARRGARLHFRTRDSGNPGQAEEDLGGEVEEVQDAKDDMEGGERGEIDVEGGNTFNGGRVHVEGRMHGGVAERNGKREGSGGGGGKNAEVDMRSCEQVQEGGWRGLQWSNAWSPWTIMWELEGWKAK